MDPFALVKTIWRFKWVAAPGVFLLILGAVYVVVLAPRTYEATAIYIIANPNPPTDREIEQDSRLGRLNDDNPYLRADDKSLIVQALVSKMSSSSVQQEAEAAGIDTDYTVAQSPTSSMTVVITAVGGQPSTAVDARGWLISKMGAELRIMQTINGANDRFLFTALPIDLAPKATEKVSSRLRSLILVVAGGLILVLASVSVAVGVTRRRESGEAPSADGSRGKSEVSRGSASTGALQDRVASEREIANVPPKTQQKTPQWGS